MFVYKFRHTSKLSAGQSIYYRKSGVTTKYVIGCSGFYYRDWKGLYYPEDLAQKKWLEYYAETFHTVEVNSSFYRMPKESAVEGWRERTPDDFAFILVLFRDNGPGMEAETLDNIFVPFFTTKKEGSGIGLSY